MNQLWAEIIAWVPWSVLWVVWGMMILVELYIVIRWELQTRANYVQPTGRSWDKKDPYANLNEVIFTITFGVIFLGGMVNWVYIIFLPIMLSITAICLFCIYFVTNLIVKFAPESDQAKTILEFKQKHLTRKKKIVPEVVDKK